MLEHGMMRGVSSGSPSYSPVTDIFGDGSGKALYRLDGNTNEESGTYHGTEGTIVKYGGGQYERGINLTNATTSYFNTNYTINTTVSSVSFWVNRTTTNTYDQLINTGNNPVVWLGGGGSYILYCSNGIAINAASAPVIVNNNQWYHICFVDTGTVIQYYKDGVLQSNSAAYKTMNTTIWNGIGGTSPTASDNFTGNVDHLRFFNRAITQAEVNILYTEGEPTSIINDINPFGDTSCKALYKFENDATDATGVYNGTATNVTYGTGKFGSCAVFNGTALISTSFTLSANVFSYSGWFKVTTPSSTIESLIDFTTNRAMLSSGNGTNAYVSYYDGGTYRTFSAYTLPANTFVFLSLVINGTTAYLYVDGVLKGTSACTAIVPSGGMYFGRYAGSASGFLTGSIDQLRIFDKALTPLEIASLYNETTPLGNPMGHQVDPFKDGSGKALYRLEGNILDESGNYNGTASSITYGTGQTGRCATVTNSSTSYFDTGYTIPSTISSVSLWARRTTTNTYDQLINAGNNPVLWLGSGGSYVLYGNGGIIVNAASAPIVVNNNQWYHICFVDNGSVVKYYKDGVLQSNGAAYKSMINTVWNGIGGKSATVSDNFTGNVDQVRFFNKALSQAEITALYTNQA